MITEEKNTKEKILEAANHLFAANGFAGTSIREIANEAEVNLAAINYHFKNKDNLYWQVFDHNHRFMEKSISEIGKTTKTTEELTIEVFRFFMSGKSAIMNTFKIFLSDNVHSHESSEELNCSGKFGPPGQEAFFDKISTEAPEAADACKRWAIKMIFSLVVHFGVIMHTTTMKIKCQEDDELSIEALEASLMHSVKAHLKYLKENPKFF